MDDETPMSPPGSWPAGSEASAESPDVRRYSGPETETVENVEKAMSKGKEKDTKNACNIKAMLPPEILEQYVHHISLGSLDLISVLLPYLKRTLTSDSF